MSSREVLNPQVRIVDVGVDVTRALKLYNIYCSRFGYHFRHDLNAYLVDSNGRVLKTIKVGEWECSREDAGEIRRIRDDGAIEKVDAKSELICGPKKDVRTIGTHVEELTRNKDFNVWLFITGTAQYIRTAPAGCQVSGGVCCSKYWDRTPFPMPREGEWIALALGNPWVDVHPPEIVSTHTLTLRPSARDLESIATNLTGSEEEHGFDRRMCDENGLIYEKLKCNASIRKTSFDVSIMSFQRDITIERMIEELNMCALTPASLEDILSLVIEFPQIFLNAAEEWRHITTIEMVNGKNALTKITLYNDEHLQRRYPNRKLPRIHITSRVTEFHPPDWILVRPKKTVTTTI